MSQIKLIDLLRIAMGRKLSKREMEMAKDGEKFGYSYLTIDSDEFWVDGDKIVKRETRANKYYGSVEASNPEVTRSNPAVINIDTKYYDSDGFLVERHIKVDKINQEPIYQTLVYSPPGRFFGKSKSKAEKCLVL